MRVRRIMMAGPSGIGKTTIANYISKEFKIPFVSGSYSDIVPETKDIPHQTMMEETDLRSELKLLSGRSSKFSEQPVFVSDRSYIDNIAYFLLKLSPKVKYCDNEFFIEACLENFSKQCTHLIFVPLDYDNLAHWSIEDNGKRVKNIFFQNMVSNTMGSVIRDMVKPTWLIKTTNFKMGYAKVWLKRAEDYVYVKVLELNTLDLNKRNWIVKMFLKIF